MKPIVELIYGFKSGENKKSIARNRQLAEELKDELTFTFKVCLLAFFLYLRLRAYQDIKSRKGIYRNPLFQKSANAMWFANRRDEGVMYPEMFNPFPKQSLGIMLAAVRGFMRTFDCD